MNLVGKRFIRNISMLYNDILFVIVKSRQSYCICLDFIYAITDSIFAVLQVVFLMRQFRQQDR